MKRYDAEGIRVTDCCDSYSSYDEHGNLYCKCCYEAVGLGQGDGGERKETDEDIDTSDTTDLAEELTSWRDPIKRTNDCYLPADAIHAIDDEDNLSYNV